MDRTIRFAAAEWRDGDKVNKDKIASAMSGVLTKTLAAKAAGAEWNANTGKLELTFKRPSQVYPALALTETVEINALVSPDKPGASDRLMLWISSPVITTADEGPGPKLNLSESLPATRKAANRRTITVRSRRWPKRSRASAGTPTGRCGNNSQAQARDHPTKVVTDGLYHGLARGMALFEHRRTSST